MARVAKLACEKVTPSVAAELAWLLDLLVQTARYAAPALAELERSLLPGVSGLRPSVRDRYGALWQDSVVGCPELLAAADSSGSLFDSDPSRLLASLSTLPRDPWRRRALFSEDAADRRPIRRRLEMLGTDIRLRRRYRDILAEIWRLAGQAWERRGRGVVTRATTEWSRRLSSMASASDVVRLMPPRHPLARAESSAAASALNRRRKFVLVPIYFCMSGGLVTDLDERLVIGVPASALEPVRRTRDAAFVADRARVFAEPTRVHILIHLMSTPSGIMEITRALRMSQPTVSEHVRVLRAAGLIRKQRHGNRSVYVASPSRVDRLLEDARGTLSRWS